MPAITVGPPQRNEQMWQALKAHITRERQRKKQEQEADAEEERRRKEREQRQKQDVMTLGETRDQIASLEKELSQLKDEKHQLFLQLKKVLNEDDNRRRQLIKETSVCLEVLSAVGSGYPPTGGNVVHTQLFQPLPTRSPLYKTTAATPTHTLIPTGQLKRSHSPSPPPVATSYHAGYAYKPPPTMPNYNPPPTKTEEMPPNSEWDVDPDVWRNSNAYAREAYEFYSRTMERLRLARQTREPEPGKPTYLSDNKGALPPSHQSACVTNLHTLDHKSPCPKDKFYMRPTSHVTVHGGAIPIQQPPQGAKTGSITSGHPVRAPQPPPPPGPYPPPPLPTNYIPPGRIAHTQPRTDYLQRRDV